MRLICVECLIQLLLTDVAPWSRCEQRKERAARRYGDINNSIAVAKKSCHEKMLYAPKSENTWTEICFLAEEEVDMAMDEDIVRKRSRMD